MFDIQKERENGLISVIDWLSFTDVANSDIDTSLAELGFVRDEFMDAEKGAFGYKRCCCIKAQLSVFSMMGMRIWAFITIVLVAVFMNCFIITVKI